MGQTLYSWVEWLGRYTEDFYGKLFKYRKHTFSSGRKMKYKVVISEGEDGWYVVECPSIPGCVSQGKTIEEALENVKDAIQGCLDVLNERIEIKGEEKLMEVAV